MSSKFSVSRKRAAPAPVTPLIHNGIEYTASQQLGLGNVQARDTSSNQILWKKSVYTITYDEKMEEDVQDIWITKIQVADEKTLRITDEAQRVHFVSL